MATTGQVTSCRTHIVAFDFVSQKENMIFLLVYLISVFCDPVSTGIHHINKRSACVNQKYAHISGHTGCIAKSNNYLSGSVTSTDKQTILTAHNTYRSGVSPPAANMLKMFWDDELAMLAQKWAENCDFNHESSGYKRTIPGKFSVGQNLYTASGTPDPPKNWNAAIKAWYDEVQDFTYGYDNATGVVGHYTQVVWATSYKLGCGFAVCSNMDTFYVCNYGPAGNFGTKFKPYKASPTNTACSDCPSSCDNNLCDCTGKPCYNGGTVNVDTCACTCSESFYVGDTCALDCSGSTESSCGFTANQCEPYFNVPYACPTTCQSCPHGSTEKDSSATTTPGIQGETTPTNTATDGSTETTPANQGETTITSSTTDGSTQADGGGDGDGDGDGGYASRITFYQPLIVATLILTKYFL